MLKKTGVTDLVKVMQKTVPSSGSSITETALAELGSAPRLDVGGCVKRIWDQVDGFCNSYATVWTWMLLPTPSTVLSLLQCHSVSLFVFPLFYYLGNLV